jgi:recombination protein RecA
MAVAILKQQFESVLWQVRPEPEVLATGIPNIQLPRGCLTEIVGPASTGRTTLLHSVLASSTSRGETCALVDSDDAFDPATAAAAGVRLENLLWIRCNKDADAALKASDLLIQGGGFGVVAMDLGDTPPKTARRISLTSWFRLRRSVENTPTVFVAVSRQSNARTCASLTIECARERAVWSGRRPGRLFRGIAARATATERRKACSLVFTAQVI